MRHGRFDADRIADHDYLLATLEHLEIATNPSRVPPLAVPPFAPTAHCDQAKGDAREKVATEGARTVPPREHGGNCDIKVLSRGSKIYFPVYVKGGGLSMGDLHFSQGDGEITFCGAIEMAGLQRARDMGFRTDMPLYHGTDREFTEFDPTKFGSTTRAAPAALGVWVARDPEVADNFAAVAASRKGGSPQVIPLLHRANKPGAIRLSGDEMDHEIAATLANAFDAGHDAVMLKNYTLPSGKNGDVLVVKNPNQLRSLTAAEFEAPPQGRFHQGRHREVRNQSRSATASRLP